MHPSFAKKREYKDNDSAPNYYLLDLKEIGGKRFPFVLCIPEQADKLNVPKKHLGDCFVGCRFGPTRDEITRVLDPLLRYYGFRIQFGDTGLDSGQILDRILEKLDDVSFAIFDNRGTESKPNVYIEVGAAYARGVPLLFSSNTKNPGFRPTYTGFSA